MGITERYNVQEKVRTLKYDIEPQSCLELLAEESSKVIQAVMKLIRVSNDGEYGVYPVDKSKYSVRPKNLTAACGDQTLKFVGYITDDGFDSPTQDPVNHPNHYEMVGPFESFDAIVESLGIDGARYFCQGNIIKYQMRYKQKNGEEDLKKRHWYSRMDQMLAKCKTIEDYYKLKESDF